MIRIYHIYGSESETHILGRVLKHQFGVYQDPKNALHHFINMAVSFFSWESSGQVVQIQTEHKILELKTNADGYFSAIIPEANVISISYNGIAVAHQTFKAKGLKDIILVSDIDDTILKTDVTSLFKWAALIKTFFVRAKNRESYVHMAHTYERLKPDLYFYLSNSPWNLFDAIQAFLKERAFPPGVLMLRDYGFKKGELLHIFKHHKKRNLEHLVQLYPRHRFVLVGDSGEKDEVIYRKFAKKHPDKVLFVGIRQVEVRSRKQLDDTVFYFQNGIDLGQKWAEIGLL